MSTGPVARRNFLGSISAVGLLAAAPLWLQNAFAEEAACKGSLRSLAALGASFRRAHSSGKRLLVLVIPTADAEKRARGELFGAWLNHGPDSGLAALSLCELACATMDDLRRLVPNAPDGEPLMVLVDPSAFGRPGIAIAPAVPPVEESRPVWDEGADWEKVMREHYLRESSEWDARIAVVSRAASSRSTCREASIRVPHGSRPVRRSGWTAMTRAFPRRSGRSSSATRAGAGTSEASPWSAWRGPSPTTTSRDSGRRSGGSAASFV